MKFQIWKLIDWDPGSGKEKWKKVLDGTDPITVFKTVDEIKEQIFPKPGEFPTTFRCVVLDKAGKLQGITQFYGFSAAVD